MAGIKKSIDHLVNPLSKCYLLAFGLTLAGRYLLSALKLLKIETALEKARPMKGHCLHKLNTLVFRDGQESYEIIFQYILNSP